MNTTRRGFFRTMLGAAAGVALAPVVKLLPAPEIAPMLAPAPLAFTPRTFTIGFTLSEELLADLAALPSDRGPFGGYVDVSPYRGPRALRSRYE